MKRSAIVVITIVFILSGVARYIQVLKFAGLVEIKETK